MAAEEKQTRPSPVPQSRPRSTQQVSFASGLQFGPDKAEPRRLRRTSRLFAPLTSFEIAEGRSSEHDINFGMLASAFLALKRTIIPRGVFGRGRRARTAETLAFFVYFIVLAVSVNWVIVYTYLYFNSNSLGSLSTTFHTYRSLEAPSFAVCRDVVGDPPSESALPELSASLSMIHSHSLVTARLFPTPCPQVGSTCLCVNTYLTQFYDHYHQPLSGTPLLHDEEQWAGRHSGTLRMKLSTLHHADQAIPLQVGIYSSEFMPSAGDSPTWFSLMSMSKATVGVSVVRSWVLDPNRVQPSRLLRGHVAHAETSYLLDLHGVAPVVTSEETPAASVSDARHHPFLEVQLSFATYTVVEVWRVGASFSLALAGLTAICVSAFNKIFIFNTLFPYYDSETPQKLRLTLLARVLTCDIFGSNHEELALSYKSSSLPQSILSSSALNQ